MFKQTLLPVRTVRMPQESGFGGTRQVRTPTRNLQERLRMHECTCSRAEQHQQSLPGPRLQTARPDAGAGRAPALASLEAANIGVTLSRPAPGLRAPLQRSAPSRGALAARHPGKPCILPRVAVSPQQRSAPGAAPRQRAARPVLKSLKREAQHRHVLRHPAMVSHPGAVRGEHVETCTTCSTRGPGPADPGSTATLES